MKLEPLERRELLAVVSVAETDSQAAEQGNDSGVLTISLTDAQPYGYYSVEFTLSGSLDDTVVSVPSSNYLTYISTTNGTIKYSVKSYCQAQRSIPITVTPLDDARSEGDHTVSLTLDSITGYCCCCCGGGETNSIGSPSSGTITIADNDQWEVSLTGEANAQVVERHADDATVFTISRVPDTGVANPAASDTKYAIAVDLVLAGSAEPGEYTVKDAGGAALAQNTRTLPGGSVQRYCEVTIPANSTSTSVTVTPVNDAKKESDETVAVSLANAHSTTACCGGCGCSCCYSNGYPAGTYPTSGSGTVTILDDDWWKVGITAPEDDQLVREPGEGQPEQPDPTTTLSVKRTPSKDTTYEMDASYSVKVYLELDLTGVNLATPGFDYELLQGLFPISYWSDPSATIPVGATERVLTFRAKGDWLPEMEEDAPIAILPDCSCDAIPYTVDGDAALATVSIQDNDWTVLIGAGDADASEDSDETTGEPLNPGQFQITRVGSGPADHDLPVKFTIPYSQAFADSYPGDHWDYALVVDETVHGTGSGAAVSLVCDAGTNSYMGTATIPGGAHTLAVKLAPNDDEYLELDEDVTPTLTENATSCCGGEAGICYVVNSTSASATVTIEDNDDPELFAVTYRNANYITTDPVYSTTYNNGQFANYLTNTLITQDHWFDVSVANEAVANEDGYTSDRSYPVSYVRNAQVQVTAEWYRAAEPGYLMHAQGAGPDGILISCTANADGNISRLICGSVLALPNTIKYYPNFQIAWMYSVTLQGESAGPDWAAAGSNSSELYVTLGQPQVDTLYHTYVHIGTDKANGKSAEPDAIAAIWSYFEGLDVRRRDDTQLVYYGPPIAPLEYNPTEATAEFLLTNAVGRCGAWAKFFVDILRAQGIMAGQRKEIRPLPVAGQVMLGMELRNDLDGQGVLPPGYPLPYQFQNHGVVLIGGTIYDPSYGEDYSSLIAWENACLVRCAYDVPPYIPPYYYIDNTLSAEETYLINPTD